MNTKYLSIALGIMLTALIATPVLAAQSEPEVRVINLKAYGGSALTDADLVKLAHMDVAANPEIFPSIAGFGLTIAPCPVGYIEGSYVNYPEASPDSVAITGMIKEKEPYRFGAISDKDMTDSYPVALVKADGSVLRIGGSMGVTEDGTALASTACLLAKPGDTILTFANTGAPEGPTAAGIANVNGPEGPHDSLNNNEDSGAGGTSGGNDNDL